MTRLEATIDHPKDRQSFDLTKARDVAVAHVPTCADKTYTNFFLSHEKPPYRERRGKTNGITALAPGQQRTSRVPQRHPPAATPHIRGSLQGAIMSHCAEAGQARHAVVNVMAHDHEVGRQAHRVSACLLRPHFLCLQA